MNCYFIRWGRTQATVDPRPLEAVILSVASHFALPGKAASARVCETPQDAREAPLFYEALLDFAQRKIPFGDGYEPWRREMDELMRIGKQVYFAGPWRSDGSQSPSGSAGS